MRWGVGCGADQYISSSSSSSFYLHFEPSPTQFLLLLDTNTTTTTSTTHPNSHTAPIWQISWAHPSFGSILASCSYDSRVFVWKETSSSTTTTNNNSTSRGGLGGKGAAGGAGEWEKIKEVGAHSASGKSMVEHGGGQGRLLHEVLGLVLPATTLLRK